MSSGSTSGHADPEHETPEHEASATRFDPATEPPSALPGVERPEAGREEPQPFTVLVYSDDPRTREAVRFALGRRPDRALPPVEYVDVATGDEVVAELDTHTVDLAILDGEATPTGGMGLCRQAKNEVAQCPPILVLTGRRDDRWLATWSLADASVPHPLDPVELIDRVVELLHSVQARRPVLR